MVLGKRNNFSRIMLASEHMIRTVICFITGLAIWMSLHVFVCPDVLCSFLMLWILSLMTVFCIFYGPI